MTNNINRILSYLPTSWLDKHKEVNGDSIFNERSILCTKSILHSKWLHTKQYWMRHCMKLHTSSFSVGQSIQSSIGTYRDNISKFIVYILLILNESLFKMSVTVAMAQSQQFACCGYECNGCPFKYWMHDVIFTQKFLTYSTSVISSCLWAVL